MPDSESFGSEYVFEWEVPDACVTHRVTLDTLHKRHFTLRTVHVDPKEPFPRLIDFRQKIAAHAADVYPCDHGYSSGLAAYSFGARAPVDELAWQMSRWVPHRHFSEEGGAMVDEGLAEAIVEPFVRICIGNDSDWEERLDYLLAKQASVEYDPMQDDDQADRKDAEVMENREKYARKVEEIYSEIGL